MAEAEANVGLQRISQANSLFNFDLYKVLAQEQGNLFYSPISIQIILALVFLGARGDTAKQLARGLHLPEERNVTEDSVSAIVDQLEESNNASLEVANRIFLKSGFHIKEGFNQSAIRFLAGIEAVDFAQENSRTIINQWVEKRTNNKIKDLIPPGVLNEYTRMVLVNAIYFKSDWLKQFKKDRTSPMVFHSAPGATNNVDMMYIEDRFQYIDLSEMNSQALLLPYKGEKISMLIFLPRELNGLADLENGLTNLNLQDVINRMYRHNVHVYLPKFKLEYEKELNNALTRLGMTDMFDDIAANFTGISDEQLKVSKVLHKAFIEVNEEGTEAAAATAVIIAVQSSLGSLPPPPIVFKADHPFMFLILHQPTMTVLFIGRYSSPAST